MIQLAKDAGKQTAVWLFLLGVQLVERAKAVRHA